MDVSTSLVGLGHFSRGLYKESWSAWTDIHTYGWRSYALYTSVSGNSSLLYLRDQAGSTNYLNILEVSINFAHVLSRKFPRSALDTRYVPKN